MLMIARGTRYQGNWGNLGEFREMIFNATIGIENSAPLPVMKGGALFLGLSTVSIN